MDKVVHFEIPFDDVQRAQKFYMEVFGWEINEFKGMDYYGVTTVPVDEGTKLPKEAGAINGGMMKRTAPKDSPVIVIDVASIDDYVKKVEEAGGELVLPKNQVGDMGFYARVSDPEGNVIGLWENAKKD